MSIKMYQKMGIDPTTEEGIATLFALGCEDIKDGINVGACKHKEIFFVDCAKCKAERLFAEIPTKKRWQTIKSDDDLENILGEWMKDGKQCIKCDFRESKGESAFCVKCFKNYLLEEIEVEVNENN